MNFPNNWETLFETTFKVPLKRFYHPIFGFDIVKFDDEVIKPPDGISCKDYITKNYSQDASDLIMKLINYMPILE